jgi:hypothetical protein
MGRVQDGGGVLRGVGSCRRVVGAVVPAPPSALDSTGGPERKKTEGGLDGNAATVYKGSQVIAKDSRIEKGTVAQRHHDVVLLELGQRWNGPGCIEQVRRDNVSVG